MTAPTPNPPHTLFCHPGSLCPAVQGLQVQLAVTQDTLHLCYELIGDIAQLLIPSAQEPRRTDGLWQHTCFELFVGATGQKDYHEFNFSPSGLWAAYAFSDYRTPSATTLSPTPQINCHLSDGHLQLYAEISLADLPQAAVGHTWQLGVSAVIESLDQTLSYWALHHPMPQADFHHRLGFVLPLKPA